MCGGTHQQIAQLAVRRLVAGFIRDGEPDHAAHIEAICQRTAAAHLIELVLDCAAPADDFLGGVLDADPTRKTVLRDAARRAFRILQATEVDRRARLLQRLRAKATALKVGELAVVLKEVVRPDALEDLDRLAHVLVPFGENVRRARGRKFLGHPAGTQAHVHPAIRQVVHGCDFARQHAGRAVRRVDDAHADAQLSGLRCQPRDEWHAMQPLATGRHRQRLRKLGHHAKRVLQPMLVGGFRHHDSVERPHRIEVERLGEVREILEFLDRHVITKIGQVESELHRCLLRVCRAMAM